MAKKANDLLKYTANIIGASVISYFIAYNALNLLFSLLLLIFHKDATLSNPIAVPEWVMGVANLVISQGAITAALFTLRSFCAKSLLPRLQFKKPSSNSAWLFLPVFLGTGVFANVINATIQGFLQSSTKYTPTAQIALPSNKAALVLYFIALCIAPAIMEEIFVRGFLQGILAKWGPWFSILVSGTLFTLLHSNIAAMPGVFILSILLGLVAWCTGSILPCIILHGANNCIAFFLLYTTTNTDNASASAFSAYIIIVLVVTAVLSIGIIIKGRYYNQFQKIPRFYDPKNRQSRFERLVTSPCFIVVMLCLSVKAMLQIF